MIDLLVIAVLSLLLVPLVLLTSGALRAILGVAFVLFAPGYTLIAALFPRRDSLSGTERLALSIGLGIAVVPLIALALNYTPLGIRLQPILVSLVLFVLIMSAIAWSRRRKLSAQEGPRPRPPFQAPSLSRFWRSLNLWDRVLAVLLVAAIAGAAGGVAYVITTPKAGERFTEFYMLGSGVSTKVYPDRLAVGENGQVLLGIVNREYETEQYRVEITISGEKVKVIGPIPLDNGTKWEETVSFAPTRVGANQKVEFLMYKGTETKPSQTLILWIDVQSRR